ncbi:MAG: ABC transporter permease [Treponema sp.]|jgi:lipoprotein-releasing system permease protein|nr:ABC transporter permease [Treponema sp.]
MGWVAFVAGRLVAKKRGTPPPVLSVLGIAVGVLALTVIISVMNGFQLGFIESILEISSYYVRINPPPSRSADKFAAAGGDPSSSPSGLEPVDGDLIRRIKTLPGVTAALPFREARVLLRGGWGQQGAVIRGLPPSALEEDPGLAAKLVFEEGAFDLAAPDSILLGAELAARLKVSSGDTVDLFSLSGGALMFSPPAGAGSGGGADGAEAGADGAGAADGGNSGAMESRFVVRGIFRSGFYEYDLGWGFINFDRAGELEGRGYTIGIKLRDRFQDRKAAAALAELTGIPLDAEGGPGAPSIRTWRDFNRAFFGALRTEKLFMFVLVGLIFIVVGLNIYQSQRRIVLERREEIGLLRAVGASDRAVRLVFVWDGFIIGFAGAGTGLALALLVSFNIAAFFSLLEKAVNGVLGLFNRGGGFAVFSPAVFYIKELKARVIPHEVFLIFCFGLFSALAAAWFASGRISRTRPVEVLRYE